MQTHRRRRCWAIEWWARWIIHILSMKSLPSLHMTGPPWTHYRSRVSVWTNPSNSTSLIYGIVLAEHTVSRTNPYRIYAGCRKLENSPSKSSRSPSYSSWLDQRRQEGNVELDRVDELSKRNLDLRSMPNKTASTPQSKEQIGNVCWQTPFRWPVAMFCKVFVNLPTLLIAVGNIYQLAIVVAMPNFRGGAPPDCWVIHRPIKIH